MQTTTWTIPDLLALHRQTFGSTRMETDPAAPPAAEAPPAPEPEKTFTQADVDRIVAKAKRSDSAEVAALKEKAQQYDSLAAASQTEQERAVEAAEKRVRAEVQRERVLDRVEVFAAKDFADAEDARLRLEKRADEFIGKDGTIDADAIKAALTDLLAEKPHLAAAASNSRPDLGQGVRTANKPDPGPGINRMRAAYATTSKTP